MKRAGVKKVDGWRAVVWLGMVSWAVARGAGAQGSGGLSLGAPTPPEIRQGQELLQRKHFLEAQAAFAAYGKTHPDDVRAKVGIGDAELGLREYEAAEATYRAVVAQQPELWAAHKNLVVVEAALGRWDDFDGERRILKLARERGAPGISARESDVIDSFSVGGERWVVRAYFEPVGRSRTLYNFERFNADGRVAAYISLEDAAAAAAALHPGDVRIGAGTGEPQETNGELALNWYTGTAHGTVRRYATEPRYEELRPEVQRWLRSPGAPPAVKQ